MPQVWGLVPLGYVNFSPFSHWYRAQVLEVGHTTDRCINTSNNNHSVDYVLMSAYSFLIKLKPSAKSKLFSSLTSPSELTSYLAMWGQRSGATVDCAEVDVFLWRGTSSSLLEADAGWLRWTFQLVCSAKRECFFHAVGYASKSRTSAHACWLIFCGKYKNSCTWEARGRVRGLLFVSRDLGYALAEEFIVNFRQQKDVCAWPQSVCLPEEEGAFVV